MGQAAKPALDDLPRVVPCDLPVERAVLGGVLIDAPATLPHVLGLPETLFHKEAHRTIHRSVRNLAASGDAVDVLTVTAELRERGCLDEVGGPAYLALLSEEAAVATNVAAYVRTLRELSGKRRLAQLGHAVASAALNGKATGDILSRIAAEVAMVEAELGGPPGAAEARHGTTPSDGGRFRPACDVLTDPPPVSIVSGLAWRRGVTVLVSESGAGKTFVLLDLVAAVGGGEKDWHGRPAQGGSVAYVSFEGDALGLRLAAIEAAHRDLRNIYFLRAGDPISPRVDREGQESPSKGELALRGSLKALAAALAMAGAPPLSLLVLDTVRASMVGSEDRSEDVAAYLRAVRRVLAEVPAAGAVLAHHAGWQDGEAKKKRERGSSAFRGNADGVFYLDVEQDNVELGVADLVLTTLKTRDDARPPPLRLRRVRVSVGGDDEYGRPRRTCVIETDPRTREDRADADAYVSAQASAALDQRVADAIRAGGITSHEKLRAIVGAKQNEVVASLVRLVRAGRILEPEKQRQPYRVVGA